MAVDKKDVQKIFWETFEQFTEEELEKAAKKDSKPREKEEDVPKSFFVNPYDQMAQTGMWRERPTKLTWATLRVIANKNPIVSAIINTRINQVGTFSSSASLLETSGNNPLGYKIIHKQKDRKLTPGEKLYVEELENFIWNCGDTETDFYSRDNFDGWLRKTVRDSLTFDAATTELIPSNKGQIVEFYPIDAESVRIAVNKEDAEENKRSFVQVMNGQIVTSYEPDEIMYGIRNPTTAMYNNGYGVSELEQLVGIVTNIFNAMAHNAMFFKQGTGAKGLINIKSSKSSGVPQEQLDAFKRAWRTMVSGSANAWVTPILQSEGVEFINMGGSNRDMEFMQYLDFLVKITCAVFSIDPSEINFAMNASGGSSAPMFESNQESKIKFSKDKGLRPLLSSVSRWINQFLIKSKTDDFYFTFTGIDNKDENEVIELRSKEVSAYKTLDEVRQEAGLKPLGDDKGGDVILNPQYMQFRQQKSMEAMEEQSEKESSENDTEMEEEGNGSSEIDQDGQSEANTGESSSEERQPPVGKIAKSQGELEKTAADIVKYIRISVED